ncbi:hypothetical protein [Ekhidna sp. To15]
MYEKPESNSFNISDIASGSYIVLINSKDSVFYSRLHIDH